MKFLNHQTKPVLLVALAAFIMGALWIAAIHFFTAQINAVHYHANFALYVSGQRDEFKGLYYEEVQSCNEQGSTDPRTRVHMHDNVNNVIHVHDQAVTWSDFFANLGYTLGDNVLADDKGHTYINGQNGKLSFILNGKPVDTIADRVIQDRDVMLISYGNDSQATLQKQYNSIPHTAEKYDEGSDPATCSGSKPLTITDRLKHAIGLEQ